MVLFSYNYMSYYTKTFAMFIFICSLCFYLYILQCNGGFDLKCIFHYIYLVYIYYIIIAYL